MEFVTNRTSVDVARWKTLHDKGWQSMNAEERAEWMSEMRGRYAYTDMNRVETAAKTLYECLHELGYMHPPFVTKTNWRVGETPTKSDFDRYFGNVERLRQAITLMPSTPLTPTTEYSLNYQRANDLEKILENIDIATTNLQRAWYYAGDIITGEV